MIDELFKRQSDTYKSYGLTVQPFIFSVGSKIENCNKFIVRLDNINYIFDKYFDALYCLLKVIFVLNLSYPKYSQDVFKFIQIFMLDMKTNSDGDISAIKNAIKIIMNMK